MYKNIGAYISIDSCAAENMIYNEFLILIPFFLFFYDFLWYNKNAYYDLKMRASFQILAIPYRKIKGLLQYCVFHRADFDHWQFITGGCEYAESPVQAVSKYEISEEGWIVPDNITERKSMCYIPTDIFPKLYLYNWSENTYVVPEYAFGIECWVEVLKWDMNGGEMQCSFFMECPKILKTGWIL